MKVVILAGGFGTRISEESHLKPKPMIEIGEKPILWHIMKEYSAYGINEFIICAGYKQHVIKEWFADYFIHTSDITFDFTKGNEMIIHNKHAEPWKVTVVDTGLNTQTDRNSYLKNYETTVYPENSIFKIENINNLEKAKILQTKEKGYTEKFLVELKQGVTIKEINNALNRIKSRGINIQQIRNERKLIVEVIDSNLEGDRLIIVMDILEELGEVWPII